jgi:conjugal transfer/entry exclusion protein
MIDPSILRAMQAAGCTTDQIIAVVEAAAAKEEERRAKRREQGRERQRRFRARNADNALHDVTERDERYSP